MERGHDIGPWASWAARATVRSLAYGQRGQTSSCSVDRNDVWSRAYHVAATLLPPMRAVYHSPCPSSCRVGVPDL